MCSARRARLCLRPSGSQLLAHPLDHHIHLLRLQVLRVEPQSADPRLHRDGDGRVALQQGLGHLTHLGHDLAWIGMDPMPTYLGDPSQASAEAGERVLEAHVAEAMAMLEEVRAGKPPFSEPILWDLRFIERSW